MSTPPVPPERTALLEAILHGMPGSVVVANASGTIVYANPAAEILLGMTIVGLTVEEWANRQPFWISHVAGCCPCRELPLMRALRGHATDAELFFKPGYHTEDVWLAMSAKPVPGGAALMFRNITPRRMLRDSVAMHRSLVEGLPLCLYRKDTEGRYLYFNRAFRRTMALDDEAILFRTDADILPAGLAENYRLNEAQVIDSAAVLERLEEHRPGGCGQHCRCGPYDETERESRFVQSVLTPVLDADGRVVGVQGAFWDATPWRRAVRDLEKANAELERVNAELRVSNGDLEQFAYIASHDLQEPARMVQQFAQLLEKRCAEQLDERGLQYLRFACDGAKRMQGLIGDLLSYSRVGAATRPMGDADAGTALGRALQNLARRVEETGAEITSRGLPCLRADESQLTQLFQNLMGNALKFCRRGTRPRIEVSAAFSQDEWTFRVKDNGIGIDPRHSERIFDIFQRLNGREEYEGNGIGLSICKRIVERHGGRIGVMSSPGEGSTFWFTIPAHWLEAD